jgi:tetratricopeptide (TPR) repeat protein
VTEVETLIAAIRERLAREDVAWFGTPEGVAAIDELHAAAIGPDQTGLADAFLVLGAAYLGRFMATGAADEPALGAAVYFLYPVHAQAEQLMPDFLVPVFGALSGTGTAPPELADAASTGLVGFYLRHRYPQVLPAAELLMRHAIGQLAEGTATRGYCQSSLAVVLHLRAAEEPALARDLLTEAIELCRAAVAAPSDEEQEQARRLGNLGRVLITWSVHFADAAAVAEGESVTQRAMDLLPSGAPYRATLEANLGDARLARASVLGQPEALPDAIALLRRALAEMPATDRERPERMFSLGVCLANAAFSGPDAAGFAEAVETIQSAIASASADPVRLRFLTTLAHLRYGWASQAWDADQLALAESDARRVVDADPGHAQALFVLSEVLAARFERSGDPGDLDAAIADGQRAADLTPPPGEQRLSRLLSLCAKLRLDTSRAAEAVTIARSLLATVAPGSADRARVAYELAIAMDATNELNDECLVLLRECLSLPSPDNRFPSRVRWELGTALLRRSPGSAEGLAMLRSAISLLPADDDTRTSYLSSLGAVLVNTAREYGDVALLEEGVASHRAGVAATATADPRRPLRLGNLGDALRSWSEFAPDAGLLEEATEVLREAQAQAPPGGPVRYQILTQLGACLRTRSERDADPAPLREAESWLRQIPAAQRTFAASQTLAHVLSDLAEYTGDAALRDEAIRITTSVLADARGPVEQAMALVILGTNQWRQATQHDDEALRATAIATLRDAAQRLPPRHSAYPTVLNTLGAALIEADEPAWALEAVEVTRRALAASPGRNARRGAILVNLSTALRQTGNPALLAESAERAEEAASLGSLGSGDARARLNLAITQYTRDPDSGVVAAMETLEEGLAELSEDHPMRVRFLVNIALFSWLRVLSGSGTAGPLTGDYSGSRPDDETLAVLRRGASAAREALTGIPDGAPEQATTQSILAEFQLRLAQRGEHADLVSVARMARSAAESPATTVDLRLRAARTWGEAAALGGRDAEALAGYALAVELLGQVAPRELTRIAQEKQLGMSFGLASDAAAIALRTGDADRALALLEQGRGILLSQQLDAHGDLSRLHDTDPGLAAEFSRLRDALSPAVDAVPFLLEETTSDRRALARQWDPLVERIRALPGMSGFLRPPAVDELRAAAADGPVVVVNVSRYRSDAMLVTTGGIDVIALPGLSPQAVLARSLTIGPLIERAYGAAGPDAIPLAVKALDQMLIWLWDTIAAPVLDRLGLRYTPDDGEAWPRLYWCPTGWLSFLPLHAAGRHQAIGAQSVLDRAISSYTPTLRTLVRARVTGSGFSDPLVVSLPQTPGAPPLPGAAAEAAVLERLFPSRTELAGPDATIAAVAAALPRFSVVHFGCHGVTVPGRASEGGLQLYDGRLRALDAAALRLPHPQLAVLAACATAQGAVALPDEAIHVTSAFQMAGYPHVIGTLWPVSDKFSAQLAELFYTSLASPDAPAGPVGGGGGDLVADPAAALHFAIRDLRDGLAAAPQLWAAHTHTGP